VDVKKSGKVAILFEAVKGSLVAGDGIAALADNSWFQIDKKAAVGSTLPFSSTYNFKSPDNANAITPIVDDDVFPITLNKICKVDASISGEKGTIDVTDDCDDGYNVSIVDGYTDLSGDISAFLRFISPGGGINETQLRFLQKFFDLSEDDGEGTYTFTQKDDEDVLLAILQNSDQIAVGDKQVWLLFPVILSSITLDKPLKGAQNFDLSYSKGQGAATVYVRTTNATETVF